MVEREAEERVAGLEQGRVDGVVGLRAGVRLDVGVLGPEQLLGAVDRELLGDVDLLAAAVVALARVALGVLVGQHRAGRLEHRLGDEVLGGDHLERVLLALELAVEHARRCRDRPRSAARSGSRREGRSSVSLSLGVVLRRRRRSRPRRSSSTRRAWRPPSKSVARKRLDDRLGRVGVEPAAGQRQHVGVVVAAAHLRLLGVVGVDRADAVDLVGDDRDADAGAADDHRPVGLAVADQPRRARRRIGVVDRLRRVGADVDQLVPGSRAARGATASFSS